jgi:hypothetical protein
MRIRLIGLPDEVKAATDRIAHDFDLVETSPTMPCRGNSRQVRVYLEIRLTRSTTATDVAITPTE